MIACLRLAESGRARGPGIGSLESFQDESLGEQLRLVSELRVNRFQVVGAHFIVAPRSWSVDHQPEPGVLVTHFDTDRVGGAGVNPRGSNNHTQPIGRRGRSCNSERSRLATVFDDPVFDPVFQLQNRGRVDQI